MHPVLPLSICLALLALAPAAQAEGPFTVTYSYAPARATSLKVVGTAGLSVTAEAGGQPQAEQTPLVFQLANQDDFVPVTIVAPSGARTRVKVEVRANTQTIMQVVVEEGRGERGDGRRFIGHASSTMGRCAPEWRAELRFDFGRGGRDVTSARAPLSGAPVQLELPAGRYDVRIFRADRNNGEYLSTASLDVSADGWTFNHGCEPSADSYSGTWKTPSGQTLKIVPVGVGNGGLPLFRAEWPGGGTGIGFVLADGTLALTGARGASMAFVYQVQGAGLSARWFITGQFSDVAATQIAMATETASGPASFGGKFDISGRSINGSSYAGSLQIDRRGVMHGMRWTLANGSVLDGIGLVQGSELVAAQGPAGTFVAVLAFDGVALKARFAQIGAAAVTTETLSR